MTGILVLVVIAVWLITIILASTTFAASICKFPERAIPVAVALVVVVAPLPLVDEIVGAHQFKRLCLANSTIEFDPTTARGKSVYLAKVSDTKVNGLWVRVTRKPWRFADATTGNTVVAYDTLMASGGWLSRAISEGGAPLLFKGFCEPGGVVDPMLLFGKLGVTQIQRSELQMRAREGK